MLRMRRVFVVALGIGLLAGLTFFLTDQAQGQRLRLQKGGGIAPVQPYAPVDPSTSKPGTFSDDIAFDNKDEEKYKGYLEAAKDCIRDKDWNKAGEALQKILDDKKDYMVEVVSKNAKTGKESTRRVNVRDEANRLIGTLEKEGLETYQTMYGGSAQQMLDQYKETSDRHILAEVARRYMHTTAGGEANELLATYYLDRGDFKPAAGYYKRLFTMAKKRAKPISITELTLFKAALAFRRNGDQKGADEAWKALKDKIRSRGLAIGDQKVSVDKLEAMFDAAESVVIINQRDWPMEKGNPARNGQAEASAPLMDFTWNTSTVHDEVDDPKEKHDDTEAWIKTAVDAQKPLNHAMIPGFHPIAANNKLIFRTYGSVAAIYVKDGQDFNGKYQAGELAWRSPLDGALTTVLSEGSNKDLINQWKTFYNQTLSNVVVENTMVGTLSTDNGKVYVVDDLAVGPHPTWMQQRMWQGMNAALSGKLKDLVGGNILRAYDVESGKLLWQLPDRNNTGDFAESHFLGAPLPIGGKLYVLNEKKSELRLVCLDPNKDGQVVRSQALCTVKNPITQDVIRRMHAVNLAYGEGVLVVPTNAGALLGVDLLTQSLIWSYPYREGPPRPTMPTDPRFGRRVYPNQPLPNTAGDFKCTPPVIQDGKVVFAAPDGESIHCVDLREGTRQWHVKRADDVYLGGVFGNKVLMVGKTHCRALSLEDGKQVWSCETGTPTGEGVASKGIYYLPVKNKDNGGEICYIELNKGIVRAHNRARKTDAAPPGNLLFHEGFMLSQNVDHVSAYPQLDVRIKEINGSLAKEPNSTYWLTERGELLLADGKVNDAVTDLRKALKLLKSEANPAREVVAKAKLKLYESFTELFQDDFPKAAAKYLDEYRETCKTENAEETGRRQARFLYLLGRGRELEGKLLDAYQAYVDFAALPANRDKITSLEDGSLKARADVWVRGRIAAMIASADKAKRRPLEEKIAKEWKAIQDNNKSEIDVDAIRRFVNTFDVPFKVGREARLRLAEALMEKNDRSAFTEVEMVLLQLTTDSLKDEDPETVAKATEALARLEIRKGTADSMKDAAAYYRKLGREFANVVIRDGRTGADLFSDLATDKRFLPYLDAADILRITGKMKAKENPPDVQRNNNMWRLQNTFVFEPEGEASPFFLKHRLVFSMQNRQLMLLDRATSNEIWNLFLPNLNDTRYYNYLYPYSQGNVNPHARYNFYQVKGHVAVLQIGPMVYGLDLRNKKVLWDRNMLEQAVPVNNNFNILPDQDGTLQLTTYDQFTGQPYARKIGMVGNLEASHICIQTQKGLVAIDPIKGTELWTKSDVPARTQIFGDDQHVYLIEVRGGRVVGNARCLRASDGVKVDVPDFATLFETRSQIVGRNLLVKETAKDAVTMRLYDVHTGKDLWKKKFDAKALACRSEDPNLAGVIEPDGKVTVVDLRQKKEIVTATLDSVELKDLKDVLLLSDGDQFYVALNKPIEANQVVSGIMYTNFSNGTRCAIVNGMFYAFDHKGEMRWYAHVPHQMVVLEQFKNIPIVVFSSRYNSMQNGGFQRWVVANKTVDKKSGKLLWDPKLKDYNGQQWYAFHVNAEKGAVDLVGPSDAVRFALDDGRKAKADNGNGSGKIEAPKTDAKPQPQPQPFPRIGRDGRPIDIRERIRR
jgi:outer membrane protein assembly factor BamB